MNAIETDRLILRNFRKDDAADLFAYLHSPVASCFLSLALADMPAAEIEAERRGENDEHMAVCLKQSGRLIGDVFAMREDDTYSVGWNFNADFCGAGLASEAARALFDHLFAGGNARRLYAYVEEHNIASQRLCRRLGMRNEGLFLEFISFVNDGDGAPIYENTMQFALLRKEWEALKALTPDGLSTI